MDSNYMYPKSKSVGVPVRYKSLYTAHSYDHDVQNISPLRNNAQFLEGGLGATDYYSGNWQPWWVGATPRLVPYYPGDDIFQSDTWRELEITNVGSGAYNASATPHGTICLRLRDGIKIDMTIDGAIRVINQKRNIILGLSATGASSALIHPKGRVYHNGSRVEIQARDRKGSDKYAKMWYKGVSFTTEQCAVVYLVDAAGTRTTTDTFLDMRQDLTLNVFYNESRHGQAHVDEAVAILQEAQYWYTDDGTDNWKINNIRISQVADGLVRIHRNNYKYQIRTSPSNGSASITTPFFYCTASLGITQHLFVRRGERRMHFDGSSFIVRNAGYSAGFDHKNQLKVY